MKYSVCSSMPAAMGTAIATRWRGMEPWVRSFMAGSRSGHHCGMPSIEVSEERGVRYLHFGSHWIQGAMRVARPWALELEYTREMMLPLAVRDDPAWPATVLQIGLGAASVTKFLYRYRPKASIMVVEIMPEVITAARQFFRMPEPSKRLRVVVA